MITVNHKDRRTRRVRRRPCQYADDATKRIVFFERRHDIDVVEEFCYYAERWEVLYHVIDSAVDVPPWWAFWRRPKLPVARVVNGGA